MMVISYYKGHLRRHKKPRRCNRQTQRDSVSAENIEKFFGVVMFTPVYILLFNN